MKKVIVLTNSINGLYNFRRELIEHLIGQGFNVIISSPNGTKMDYFREIGCKMIETNINRRGTNPICDLKLLIDYYRIITDNRPDVVLTYTIKPNVYGGIICRLLGIPHIANITGLGTALEDKGLLQRLTLSLYKLALKEAKCVFFQNKENMDYMKSNNIGAENGKLIPGSGVNLSHFRLLEYQKLEEINLLYISRIMKEKGIDQYLEAAKSIREKYPQCVFHVIGSCEEQHYLDKLNEYHNKGIIQYHGYQDDVRSFHKISHCTIHPTYYPEGMSNVLLESAACGRPIITTDRSGCREIVDHGINGYLIKRRNSQDLISKIQEFIKLNFDEKREMGLASRQKVEREFDRRIIINAYLEEINSI